MNDENTVSKTENVLRNKNYLLLFIGTLVSNIGATFYSFAISLYILSVTNNNASIQGFYLGICGVIFLIFTPIGGIIADRKNKAKIVYGTDYIRGILIIASAVAIYFLTKRESTTGIIIIIFAMGILLNFISAIFNPASGSLVRFLVKEDQFLQANAYFNSLNSFQAIIGMILAGIMYSIFKDNIHLLFIIVGICYILSGFSEMFIRYNYVKGEGELTIKSALQDFVIGLKYLKTKKAILSLIIGALFLNFFVTPYFNSSSYFVRVYLTGNDYLFSSFVTPEIWASILGAILSIGSLIMGIILGNRQKPMKYGKTVRNWLVVFSIIYLGMVAAFYAFAQQNELTIYLIIASVCMFIIGLCLVNINVPIGTVIYRDIEKEQLAKVNSLISVGAMGLTPIAASLGGIVITKAGLGVLYIFCGIGFLITTIFISLNKKTLQL
ncbi:MAG: MFS transporter [Bacilli bacterium]|nr:MFS transporter [Bacilli bacterium]